MSTVVFNIGWFLPANVWPNLPGRKRFRQPRLFFSVKLSDLLTLIFNFS
jgi:hypothetical protein